MISFRKKINDLISFEVLRRIKNILLVFFDTLGANDFFRLINRKKLIILLYHGISEKNFMGTNRRYLSSSIFEKQLIYLNKKKYKFITLTEWLKIVKEKIKNKHNYVILTFDDGFKNIVDVAYPIMKKYGGKGCFYVVSSLIESDQLIWADYINVLVRHHDSSKFKFKFKNQKIEYSLSSEENVKKTVGDIKSRLRSLSYKQRLSHLKQFDKSNNVNNFQNVNKDYLIVNWNDLNSLDRSILEIGCHTQTHPNLNKLTTIEEYEKELYQSKLDIEKDIGYKLDHLCYPTGYYNRAVIEYAKNYRYLTGVTVKYGFNCSKTDLFQLKRILMDNDFILFKFKISGLYHFVKRKFNVFF